MDYREVISYLDKRQMFGIKLGLKGIRKLLKKLGNPEKKLKIIHVAGTNGKGSVCAMLSSILQKAGYKVGMYTSPHLIRINERYKINGKDISDSDFSKYFQKIKPYIEKQTYFEITTALGFLYFYEKKVDYLILEVGMGGRLDATNVIRPLISVITNIGLEHTTHLGKTIEKIAYEKSGIIKNHIPVVTAVKGAALNIIKKISKKRKSDLYKITKINKNLKLSLKGDFQYVNAAVAIKVISILKNSGKIKINDRIIKNGLNNTLWPGRMHYTSTNILLDCAHNSDCAKVLSTELKKLKKRYKKIIMVIGILNDKNIPEMLRGLVPLVDYLIITKPRESRGEEPRIIAKHISGFNKPYQIFKKSEEAFNNARSILKKDELLLITGSCYLVGEYLEYYQ